MKYGVHYDTDNYCTVFEGRETEEETKEYIKELIADYTNTAHAEGYALDDEETAIDENGAYLMFVKSDDDFYYIYLSIVSDDGTGWKDTDGEYI